MADIAKYAPINGGNLISDFKTHFSILRTKRTIALAYLFFFVFIAFTIFLAFTPSSNPSSPRFTNAFTVSNSSKKTYNPIPSSIFSDGSYYRSHFSSIFYYFYPKPSKTHNFLPPHLEKEPQNKELHDKGEILKQNQTQNEGFQGKVDFLKANRNCTENGEKGTAENGVVKNSAYNDNDDIAKVENGFFDDLINSLLNCDMFDGNWVRDESYPLYNPGSCSLIDEQFNCFLNGRPDNGYHKLKWKPKGCTLPRLNGSHMLELLRGKRLVFVGDSLNRNMWESLICILRNSVKDCRDYNCTVEFFVSPFLVQEWEVSDKNGTKKETLRLDLIGSSADKYKDADVIVFNTGHWWTHDKTSKGKDYYQEGSHVYDELNVDEAFRKAMTTWGRWVDSNVDRMKSLVFFRGYSASHFSGGQWNSGGNVTTKQSR